MNKYNVNDVFNYLDIIHEKEDELKELQCKLKNAINNLNIEDFKSQPYESARDLLNSIHYKINNKTFLKELSDIVYEKKIQKYPELLKPTYYPEIDTLEVSNEDKLYLDKVCRKWYASYVHTVINNGIVTLGMKREYALKQKCFYSVNHLEMLKEIGVVEKYYNFLCADCCDSCWCITSETELNKHKRVWELYKFQKEHLLSSEELEELDNLECDGYGLIHVECDDGCGAYYEIENLNEFEKCLENNIIEILYKVIKKPDLTYEKL